MARINVEDSLFEDPRFELIANEIGKALAVGNFVLIAKVAQKYWVKGELIPKEIYKRLKFPKQFVEVGLVIEKDNGLYLRGSEKHFAWYVAKHGNGKKGGRPNKINNLQKPTDNLNETYENPLYSLLSTPYSLLSTPNSNSSGAVLEKSKPGPVEFQDESALILSIDKKILDNWGRLYEQEYLQRELLKAWNWYANNPRKKPKSMRGWVQALSSWFERGWKHYVKNIETQKADEFSFLRKDENEPTNF